MLSASIIAISGIISYPTSGHFMPVLLSEMMVNGVHSDPVPAVVGIQTSLAFLPICGKKRILLRISRKVVAISRKPSSGFSYMIHMILAVSIAEPPPIAMITSGLNACICGSPFIAS